MAEQERQSVEAKRVEQETAERKRDIAHKEEINKKALDAMLALGVPSNHAEFVLMMIIKGEIPNVSIAY